MQFLKTIHNHISSILRLSPHYRPFVLGVGTAITLFATFRISKYTGSLRKSATGGYTFENLNRKRTKNDALSDLTSLPLDIFLSLTMGTSAALFLTDEKKLKEDLAQIPLVSGRSLVAQEFCRDFVKEYKNVPSDVWNSRQAMENHSMQQIKNFVKNCEKRQSLIDIRMKQDMDPIDAEYIPRSDGELEELNDRQS